MAGPDIDQILVQIESLRIHYILSSEVIQALTKAQEDKERHATKKICGAEYEEKAEQIRASCEEIKKRKGE